MITTFKDQASEDIFDGTNTQSARKACPKELWRVASRKMDQLDSMNSLNELKIPPSNHFESLSGNRKGQYSVRINKQYRICFKWSELGPFDVEVTDYH